MFTGLKLKIKGLVILTFTLCFVLIGIISYTVIRTIINDNFIDLSVKNINQNVNNIQVYMKLIEETSKQVSVNRGIIKALKSQKDKSYIITTLDNVKQTHFGVLGVALFDVTGGINLSNLVSEYPSLKALKQNKIIGGFITSGGNSFWSVRNSDIAGYYNNTYYNSKYGVVTFISSVTDNDGTLYGYLFIDIDPHYFYDFFKTSDQIFPSNFITCIADSELGILPSKLNNTINNKLSDEIINNLDITGGYKISSDNKYIIVYNSLYGNSKIVILVPRAGLSSKLDNILLILALVIVLMIALSIFIGIMLTDSISVPLVDLYKKMRNNSV